VGDDQRRNRDYFGKIVEDLEAGGYEALLHYLLNYDLKDFDITNVPMTEAHAEQKQYTMSTDQEWWFDKLMSGRVYPSSDNWEATRVWATELTNDFIEYTQQWDRGFRSNQTRLGMFLRKCLPPGYTREQASGTHAVRQQDGDIAQMTRPYFYKMPPLSEARAHWDKTFGTITKWPEPTKTVDIGEHDIGDEF